MKYNIVRTYVGAIKHEIKEMSEVYNDGHSYYYEIEINNINELNLLSEYFGNLIIFKNKVKSEKLPNEYTLEIYDDYRE